MVNYVRLSPNYGSRNGNRIKKITIHHMAGNLSIETCGNVFADKSRKASSNYGIDTLGRVGLYVEEKYRAWTSSSRANDEQAVTIEVANSSTGGNWPVSEAAIKSLILLCVDICRRNNIKELKYTGDANGNLTIHSMFAKTSCCGEYLKSKIPYIVNHVNDILKGEGCYTVSKPENNKIKVDGKWGVNTTIKAQTVLGTTVDGIISNQPASNRQYLPNAYTGSWQFKYSGYDRGSQLIKAIQRLIEATETGIFNTYTIQKFQKYLKIETDGIMGPKTVKAFQEWLNNQ